MTVFIFCTRIVKISNQILTLEHFADNNLWIFKVCSQIRKFKIVYKENNISILVFCFCYESEEDKYEAAWLFLDVGKYWENYLSIFHRRAFYWRLYRIVRVRCFIVWSGKKEHSKIWGRFGVPETRIYGFKQYTHVWRNRIKV